MVNWLDDESAVEGEPGEGEPGEGDLEDHELPEDSDVEDGLDSTDLSTCPECGAVVYHDVVICPKCGHVITERQPIHRKPLWIVIGVALCLAIVVLLWLK